MLLMHCYDCHLNICKIHIPKTNIFFPDGNLELERVETSLRIDDLEE